MHLFSLIPVVGSIRSIQGHFNTEFEKPGWRFGPAGFAIRGFSALTD